MQTTQIVQASAEVVTIARLSPGDVYKRVEADYSGNSTLRFGIVESVMNNGTDSAVSAIEFSTEYNGVTVKAKVIAAGADVAIYPATPAEVEAHLDEVRKALQQSVESAERALTEAKAKQAHVNSVVASHFVLAAPVTTTDPGTVIQITP